MICDEDFLPMLVEKARKCGWQTDYYAVCKFVEWVYDDMGWGKPPPELYEPYEEI